MTQLKKFYRHQDPNAIGVIIVGYCGNMAKSVNVVDTTLAT